MWKLVKLVALGGCVYFLFFFAYLMSGQLKLWHENINFDMVWAFDNVYILQKASGIYDIALV